MRSSLLAVALAGLTLFAVASSAADSPDAAITRAALAPYRDELLRDAPALCADLARPPTVVPSASPGASCEQGVQAAFAATASPGLSREAVLSLHAFASHLEIDGNHATGAFSLTLSASEPAPKHGTLGVKLMDLGNYELSLEEVAGRWLVSSQARLAVVEDCVLNPPGHCRPGVNDLLFVLGVPRGTTPGEAIPTPTAVRRAGGRERREFVAGRTVFAESGCLACHKLASEGNRGPGQNLTHVGAQLSSPQIEHAILSPRAPMPSFKNLPAKKLHDLVRFLSLLR
jgi:hypothetical protein